MRVNASAVDATQRGDPIAPQLKIISLAAPSDGAINHLRQYLTAAKIHTHCLN